MGVHPTDSQVKEKETQVFDVEKEVISFIDDEERKVLLIQGGGGSGKSLFCHIFAKKLLEEDGIGWIPMFINLPTLKDPVTQVIQETLRNNRFSEEEINEM